MKVFVPLRDDEWPLDAAAAVLPLVPFRLDFACQRDLERDGSVRTAACPDLPPAAFSDGSPEPRPA